MTWHPPKTWAVGELVSAADLNEQVRDNLLAIGQHYKLRKTADESVTSSTTLQNDDTFVFAVGASTVWAVEGHFFYEAASAGGIKIVWVLPASSGFGRISALVHTSTSTIQSLGADSAEAPIGANVGNGAGSPRLLRVSSLLEIGVNAGNAQFQWAQNTSNGTATKLLTNSFLVAHRIA
jgi:hypothetical protein